MSLTGSVSTDRVDYVQRCGAGPDLAGAGRTAGPAESRRLLHVRGIGRPDKYLHRVGNPPTAELLTGLYGYRIPLAFSVTGDPSGVEIHFGVWSLRKGRADLQERRRGVIASVLRGLYPILDAQPVEDEPTVWPLSGHALGIPAPLPAAQPDDPAPWDQIIRSMAGTRFRVLVLAFPMSETGVAEVRQSLLNELRAVSAAGQQEGQVSPLLEHYSELLRLQLVSTSAGLATGAWRTAAYLLGDGDSYPRLATAWRSVFSGELSLPEPVRVFDGPDVAALAEDWALADPETPGGPGLFERPFEAQTMLTTAQLASYVHLPETETPGFAIDLAPRFDSVRAIPTEGDVSLGAVLSHKKPSGVDYRLDLAQLTRHVMVAGLTGSGKTNTIFSLLTEADAAGVPFLVLEPAKTEYRALIRAKSLGDRVRVFTAGRDTVSPLLLNPFEVPAGITVAEHLDLIRAAFAASFGMWTPLPQILERCLHEVYADRGWDLRTDTNTRADTDGLVGADAWPRLSDLIVKVGEVIPTLGYEDKIAGDLRAALVTRLDALRAGGKGSMLDVGVSMSMDDLLAAPTVIELEGMGDEGDKAFISALILIRLAEHRRAAGQQDDLVHLLVVEEAHRLLANVGRAGEGMADPRGQAVEVFSNLLSEIRAYGQGVVIADQVPVRLAPDVIKNTDLKIAHRLVANDDRFAMGGAMAMDEAQARALTTLAVGEAAVFSTGDDSPVLVRIPLAKDPLSPVPPTHDEVAAHMADWTAAARATGLFWPVPSCAQTCAASPAACVTARRLAEDDYVQRIFARTILSTITDPSALERLWPDLTGTIAARRPPGLEETELLRAFAGHASDWYARHRGVQGGWSFPDTDAFGAAVRGVLLAKIDGRVKLSTPKRAALQEIAERLHHRSFDPYAECTRVCGPTACRWRSSAADLVTSGRYRRSWRDADAADARENEGRQKATWELCQDAGYELIEFPDDATPPAVLPVVLSSARQMCMCFQQQMLAEDYRKVPRTVRRILGRTLYEAGL